MEKRKKNNMFFKSEKGHVTISIPLIPALVVLILILSLIFVIKQKIVDNRMEKEFLVSTESNAAIYAKVFDDDNSEVQEDEQDQTDSEGQIEVLTLNKDEETQIIETEVHEEVEEKQENESQYINGVPFIDQMELGYPTGCEAVSAVMVARFAGYNISVSELIGKMPKDLMGKRKGLNNMNEEVWFAEDPFKYFIGNPTKTTQEGSYGCYAEPVRTALNNCGIMSINLSGESIETIYNYIAKGRPVIVWCTLNAKDIQEGETWIFPDGSGKYTELIGEHCAVLVGYDNDNVYLNDPIAGKGVSQPKWKFEQNWVTLHSQAIIIK